MWHVEKNHERGRGGLKNHDGGRSSFDGDYGADIALAWIILFKISKSFPKLSSKIEILLKNGFVLPKGPELMQEDQEVTRKGINKNKLNRG